MQQYLQVSESAVPHRDLHLLRGPVLGGHEDPLGGGGDGVDAAHEDVGHHEHNTVQYSAIQYSTVPTHEDVGHHEDRQEAVQQSQEVQQDPGQK